MARPSRCDAPPCSPSQNGTVRNDHDHEREETREHTRATVDVFSLCCPHYSSLLQLAALWPAAVARTHHHRLANLVGGVGGGAVYEPSVMESRVPGPHSFLQDGACPARRARHEEHGSGREGAKAIGGGPSRNKLNDRNERLQRTRATAHLCDGQASFAHPVAQECIALCAQSQRDER